MFKDHYDPTHPILNDEILCHLSLLFDRIDLLDNLLFQERTRLNQELNLIRYNIELRWCLTLPLQCCYRVWQRFCARTNNGAWHVPSFDYAEEFWSELEETLKELELL